MPRLIIVALLMMLSCVSIAAAPAAVIAQTLGVRVPLSFIGTKGEPVLTYANIAYERKAEFAEPFIDWRATQVVIMRPAAGGGFFRGGGAALKPDGNFGQMMARGFGHAKRLRNRELPNGRLATLFEFIGGFTVKDSKDLEAALAVAFLAAQDGRRLEPVMILGGLDAQGRLTAVADLEKHLTFIHNLGHQKVIIPAGQGSQMSEPIRQAVESNQFAVVEAATLQELYALVASDDSRN